VSRVAPSGFTLFLSQFQIILISVSISIFFFAFRQFCVYLLQGTTGALILAKTKAQAWELSQQFRTRTIEKTYLALIRGDPQAWNGGGAGPGARTSGLITNPLSLDDGRVRVHQHQHQPETQPEVDTADHLLKPGHQLGHAIVGKPGPGIKTKAARTAWEVLASSSVSSLCRL
jgi:hypothetical protein